MARRGGGLVMGRSWTTLLTPLVIGLLMAASPAWAQPAPTYVPTPLPTKQHGAPLRTFVATFRTCNGIDRSNTPLSVGKRQLMVHYVDDFGYDYKIECVASDQSIQNAKSGELITRHFEFSMSFPDGTETHIDDCEFEYGANAIEITYRPDREDTGQASASGQTAQPPSQLVPNPETPGYNGYKLVKVPGRIVQVDHGNLSRERAQYPDAYHSTQIYPPTDSKQPYTRVDTRFVKDPKSGGWREVVTGGGCLAGPPATPPPPPPPDPLAGLTPPLPPARVLVPPRSRFCTPDEKAAFLSGLVMLRAQARAAFASLLEYTASISKRISALDNQFAAGKLDRDDWMEKRQPLIDENAKWTAEIDQRRKLFYDLNTAYDDAVNAGVVDCAEHRTAPPPPPPPPPPPNPDKNSHSSVPGVGLPCGRAGAVLAEINAARSDPASYAKSWPVGGGSADLGEALTFLNRQSPLPPLTASPQLDGAAAGHAADQGSGDRPSHTGTNGSSPRDRIQAAGVYSMIVAEEISLGQNTGAGVVRQLIVDAGNPSHLHRADLFSPLERFAGVGCGPNKAFHTITVIDLAGAAIPR